jgi:excisionase family DNA binding protein
MTLSPTAHVSPEPEPGVLGIDYRREPPLTYSIPTAAELLGISRGSAYAAADRGELPTVSIGRRRLVPRARLLALLADGSGDAPCAG